MGRDESAGADARRRRVVGLSVLGVALVVVIAAVTALVIRQGDAAPVSATGSPTPTTTMSAGASASTSAPATASASVSPGAAGSASPTRAGAGGATASVPPRNVLPTPSLQQAMVAWPVWKAQAGKVCQLQRLQIWGSQLSNGTDGPASDTASKQYAAEQLRVGSNAFYTIMSGLGVSSADKETDRTRAEILESVHAVGTGIGSPASVSAGVDEWSQARTTLGDRGIAC